MIGRITGILIEKSPPLVCIDVNGVGYDIDVPMSTLYELPELGQKVTLFTHLAIREDAHVLFGFLKEQDRQTFRTLIRITGIGNRTALAIMSGMSSDDLALAVSQEDAAILTRVPGIGKKTAERLLLELRGKFTASQSIGQPARSNRNDILNALIALGYSEKESLATLGTLEPGVEVAQGIRLALKALAK